MTSRPRIPRHAFRTAMLMVLGVFACDLGVEPPPDTPVLAVSAREVDLFVTRGSDEPDAVTVVISNNGRGTLSGLRVADLVYGGAASGWLDTALADTTITLTAWAVTAAGDTLPTGLYEASVDVMAEGASNSPRTIAVHLTVGKSQQIALSVSEVTFAAMATNTPPPSQGVTISNGGDGVLSLLEIERVAYRAGEQAGWLDASLLRTRAPASLELRPTVVPPSKTKLHATVFVGSRIADPTTDSVLVEYIVAPPPTLALSTTSLAFDAVEGDSVALTRAVRLEELERRPLTGLTDSVSANSGWLASWRDTSVAPATLTIQVDPKGLPDAVYRGTVFVSSSADDVEEVSVSLTVRRGPTIHLSSSAVRFTTNPTAPLPPAQLVRIENSGAGTLSGLTITDATPTAWLRASLQGTTVPSAPCATAPCDLVLQVVDTVARHTSETATVEIAEPGGTAEAVTVVFEMLPGPSIALSSDSIMFRVDSGQATADSVVLWAANGGDGHLTDLVVDAASAPPWLNVSLAPAAPGGLHLWPVTTDMEPGDSTGSITVSSVMAGNDTVTIPVVYRIGKIAVAQNTIAASADSVGFTAVRTDPLSPTAVLGIASVGLDTVRITDVRKHAAWLEASLEDNDAQTPTRLILSTDVSGLSPRVYTDTVTVVVQHGPDLSVPVTLRVTSPSLTSSTSLVTLRAYEDQPPSADSQVVWVDNGAAGELSGVYVDVRDLPDWLRAAPAAPTAAPTAIALAAARTDLAPGTRGATVPVRSAVAANSPLSIDVRFEVDSGPTLRLETDAVRLGGMEGSPDSTVVTVDIYNGGKGDLGALSVGPVQSWLTARIESSDVPARLVLVARSDTLNSSTYQDNVVVTSANGGAAALAVTFAVAPQPEIFVSPGALVFHANALTEEPPAAQAITVFDPAGGPSGDVSAASDASWLDVAVDAGTAPVTVVTSPNAVLSSAGSPYTATVTVTSTVGTSVPQQVLVTYYVDVGLDPVIDLSRDVLTFDRPASSADTIPAQTVEISNGGSRTLRELSVADVTAGGPVDWLFVLLDSRIAPARLTVAIKPAEAAATQRTEATLAISAEDAETRYITVRLQ